VCDSVRGDVLASAHIRCPGPTGPLFAPRRAVGGDQVNVTINNLNPATSVKLEVVPPAGVTTGTLYGPCALQGTYTVATTGMLLVSATSRAAGRVVVPLRS
jgi:hypothetical protein